MDTTADKEAKTLSLIKSELELVENQLQSYKEPVTTVVSKEERKRKELNRHILKSQQMLLQRVILTAERIIY